MGKKVQYLFKNAENYSEFLQFIRNFAKNESVEDKQKHIKILNTKKEVLCIPMGEIRKIAKQIAKDDPHGFLKFAGSETYEEVLLQGLVIAEFKDLDEQTRRFDDYVLKIDCWAHCDSVISSMKLLKKSKQKGDYFSHYYKMCFSDEEFVSRFGIITLMVNFMEEAYIDDILQMCKQVKNDAYYVKMAVAWLISEAFVKFRERALAVLASKTLDKFTQNKAISKCRESFRVSPEDKELLLDFKL